MFGTLPPQWFWNFSCAINPKQVGRASALKNRGFGDTQGTTEVEQMDGECRPQGCLLHNSGSPTHITISVRAEILLLL